jgi:hypothetical protein
MTTTFKKSEKQLREKTYETGIQEETEMHNRKLNECN